MNSRVQLNESTILRGSSYEYITDLNESAFDGSVVDHSNILGIVRGPFFAINRSSGNKRYYSETLWKNALEKTKNIINDGEMVGTIGHEQPLTDKDLLEGKGSHRVTKLWIDKSTGLGMGEVVILATESGRTLNSYLRGGLSLGISSRATGEFSGVHEDGSQIINPDTYDLETFDFVRTPGVSFAKPKLVENQKSSKPSNQNLNEDHNMSGDTVLTQVVESLNRDKVDLQTRLTEAMTTVQTLQAQVRTLESSSGQVTSLQNDLAQTRSQLAEVQGKLTSSTEVIEAYKLLGTPDEVSESLSKTSELTRVLADLGTIEEIKECLDLLDENAEVISTYSNLKSELAKFEALGSPDQISQCLDILEKFVEVTGSPDQANEALDILESYVKLGSIDEIKDSQRLVSQYESIGSVEDINKAFDIVEGKLNSDKLVKVRESAQRLSSTYGIDIERATELLGKFNYDQAVQMVESLGKTSRYRKPEGSSSTSGMNEGKGQDETKGRQRLTESSRLDRLSAKYQ